MYAAANTSAWPAEEVTGPYHFYRMEPSIPDGDRGVYGLPAPDYEIEVQTTNPEQRIEIYGHLASPRVYVDNVNRRFVMFFHALSGLYEFPDSTKRCFNGQLTLLTTSTDGLDFRGNLKPIRLGRSYFHVWEHDGRAYAFANDGMFYLSPEGSTIANDGWWTAPSDYDHHHNHVNHPREDSIWRRIEPGPLRAAYDADPDEEINDPRHSASRKVGNELHLFYTCRNDGPEVIWLNKMDLSGDWSTWEVSWPPEEILRPELDWEGASYHPIPPTPVPPPASTSSATPSFTRRTGASSCSTPVPEKKPSASPSFSRPPKVAAPTSSFEALGGESNP